MRLLLLLVLLVASGCSVETAPFVVTVANEADSPAYVFGSDERGVVLGLEEVIDGAPREVFASLATRCISRCSAPPIGTNTCVLIAREPPVPFAIVPGDTASRTFPDELWYATSRGCARRAPLTGLLFASVCHGTELEGPDGPVDAPDASGPVEDPGASASIPDLTCETVPVELVDGEALFVISD